MLNQDLATAQSVLNQELKGLEGLRDWLGEVFLAAVDLLWKTKGRVIVSGMGKSGHIAHKISATLASTGTPAFFVHPGEASHGDLGMISQDDVVVLLSNSGETKELQDIIDYTKRFSIPLIAMVRRQSSVLVEASDVALVLPDVAEACSVNAPTTSTTMMLALGDALAVTLLNRRGFTGDDYRILHPGGKLGAAFSKVGDLMHQEEELPLVGMEDKMTSVLLEMTKKHFGCAGVVDVQGKLAGIITDGDLRRHMDNHITKKQAQEIMTVSPVTLTEHELASKALAIMEQKSITALFVLKDGAPQGILHIHDLLHAGVV